MSDQDASAVSRPQEGDELPFDEHRGRWEDWGREGEELVLIDPDEEWEATATYATVEIVEVQDLD